MDRERVASNDIVIDVGANVPIDTSGLESVIRSQMRAIESVITSCTSMEDRLQRVESWIDVADRRLSEIETAIERVKNPIGSGAKPLPMPVPRLL